MMERIKVFISSRSKTPIKIGLDKTYSLEKLRLAIDDQLEKEYLFQKQLFEVIIHEKDFNGDFSRTAYDECMKQLMESNIVIILYTGEAGWAPEGTGLQGICHDEFAVASQHFSAVTHAINLSSFVELPTTGEEFERNNIFQQEVARKYNTMESVSAISVEELEEKVMRQIREFIFRSMLNSVEYHNRSVKSHNVHGSSLNWSKHNYTERSDAMKRVVISLFKNFESFKEIILLHHVIPDNMSVADARNRIGRPFIAEHEQLAKHPELKSGVIHTVTIYGNATAIQVKNLVGYPDITVISSSFGYYLWEKTSQIQMVFLTKCINPEAISMQVERLRNWFMASGEEEKIKLRAKARYNILNAIHLASTNIDLL